MPDDYTGKLNEDQMILMQLNRINQLSTGALYSEQFHDFNALMAQLILSLTSLQASLRVYIEEDRNDNNGGESQFEKELRKIDNNEDTLSNMDMSEKIQYFYKYLDAIYGLLNRRGVWYNRGNPTWV